MFRFSASDNLKVKSVPFLIFSSFMKTAMVKKLNDTKGIKIGETDSKIALYTGLSVEQIIVLRTRMRKKIGIYTNVPKTHPKKINS